MSFADPERVLKRFIEYVSYDSESYHEKALGERVKHDLEDLGLSVFTEGTQKEYLKAHPESYPNIYAYLKGDKEGEPLLLSAHLDTVKPGTGKEAIVNEGGRITSKGDTVLGADDVSGLSAILEALTVVKEKGLSHPDIEVLISPAEEVFCEGASRFDLSRIRSKSAYVLDLTGPIGTLAYAAPTVLSFEIEIKGRAAHAGFEPEKGINALNIAVGALNDLKTGHLDEQTTLNFGTIQGGTIKNAVPGFVRIEGEVRSMDGQRALSVKDRVFARFKEASDLYGGTLETHFTEHVKAYRVEKSGKTVERFVKAVKDLGLTPSFTETFGGSDGNYFNEKGIETVVLASGMEKVHSTEEYTTIDALVTAAELTIKLITA